MTGVTAEQLAAAHAEHDAAHAWRHGTRAARLMRLGADEHYPHACLNNCGSVSAELAMRFGWVYEEGRWHGPGAPARGHEHAWNRLPDGTILDATLDQYGLEDPVGVFAAGDRRQQWYVAEESLTAEQLRAE